MHLHSHEQSVLYTEFPDPVNQLLSNSSIISQNCNPSHAAPPHHFLLLILHTFSAFTRNVAQTVENRHESYSVHMFFSKNHVILFQYRKLHTLCFLKPTEGKELIMRIAIVDDLAKERLELKERLNTLIQNHRLAAELSEFDSGTAFLEAAGQNPFQVVFLDIYMDTVDGIQTAEQLRTFDRNCLLIFTTTSTDHALDGFRVRALHYLVKPYSEEELSRLFEEILQRLPAPAKYITIKTGRENVRLRLSDILYAEHYQHVIHIYLSNGKTLLTRMTFSSFTAQLASEECFFLCNRGVLVNMEYAADFDGTAFLLKNGVSVPVSRDNAKKARHAFGDYLFRN